MSKAYGDVKPLIHALRVRGLEPQFPTILDATALSSFKLCPRKFFWDTLYQQVNAEANPHFNAGGAYALGHDVFRKLYYGKGVPFVEALLAGAKALIKEYGMYEPPADGKPSESAKTWDRTLVAYLEYYAHFHPTKDYIVFAQAPDPTDGVTTMSEFSFAAPFYDLKNPQTGDPILYGGKFDGIVHHSAQQKWDGNYDKWKDRPLWGYDDKTTYAMGAGWAEKWKMRSQFLGYTWGAGHHGYNLQGFVVRGCAIQKTQIKHLSVPQMFPQWKLDEWVETTYDTIQRVISLWENEAWTKDFDGACEMYGGCPLLKLCDSPNPATWLNHYKRRTWSPIEVASL